MKFTFASSVLVASSLFASSALAAWDLNGSKGNMMVYWGQNAYSNQNNDTSTHQKRLVEYCKDADIDAITIGFVKSWNSVGTELTLDVSNACGWPPFPTKSHMFYCANIEADIQACQKTYNKKIFISIGGAGGDYTGFEKNDYAIAFGYLLWNTFGRGWAYERPFGNAVVDGFDFDIEKGHGLRYSEVARTLRRMMDADKTKQYYLTASPQCFFPDALISDAMEKIPFDAAFIQFYNNPCHAHSWNKNSNHMTNDAFNWGMWHNWATTKSMNKNIKLFLTVPLSPAMASNGYVARNGAVDILNDVIRKYPSNVGGVGGWDISANEHNTDWVGAVKNGIKNLKRRSIDTAGDVKKRHWFRKAF